MSEDNKGLKIGDELKYMDIVTVIEVDGDNVKVRTDLGFEFWATRDNLE